MINRKCVIRITAAAFLLLAPLLSACAGGGAPRLSATAAPSPMPTVEPVLLDERYMEVSVAGGAPTEEGVEVPWDEVCRVTVRYTKAGEEADVTGLCSLETGDPSIFTVGDGMLYAAEAGSAALTVRCGDASVSLLVTVRESNLSNVRMYDETVSLPLALYGAGGQAFDMILCADFDNGRTYDATGKAAWAVRDAGVAAVEGGRITALAAGKTRVTARYGGLSAEASLEVFGGMPDGLTLDVGSVAVAGGSPLALNALLSFGERGSYPATAFIAVSSGNPDVARAVYEDGAYWIQGLSPGQSTIVVSAFALSETVTITVNEKK